MSNQIPPSRGTTQGELIRMHQEAEGIGGDTCDRCRATFYPSESEPGGITGAGRFCPDCYREYLIVTRPTLERHRKEMELVIAAFMGPKP